jgi:choline dehydrogenase
MISNFSGPWTAGAINTVAFPSLPSISLNWTNMMYDAANQSTSQHLLLGLDSTIIAGYEAQKTILINLLSRLDVGAYEILNDNIGLLSVATMHPFSRGSVHIQSTNPFLQPLIDPRYCSNPLDCQVLVEALLFNNQLIDTKSMRLLEPGPYAPFFPNATAETLMPAIQKGIRTEFHGTGTTSMLPLNLGGVVDTHLRVYGMKNLRVVDAGIIPLVPAAHLQAAVYAIAEKVSLLPSGGEVILI